MNEVHIPDQVYRQAAKAAKSQYLSLDGYWQTSPELGLVPSPSGSSPVAQTGSIVPGVTNYTNLKTRLGWRHITIRRQTG
jgi:hypothetical protein